MTAWEKIDLYQRKRRQFDADMFDLKKITLHEATG